MNKKSFSIICVLLLLVACQSGKEKSRPDNLIDFVSAYENQVEMKLSQLGNKVHYVPLETTDSSLIGNSYNICLLEKYILVNTDARCLLFDKESGKFIRQIGHKGEDPKGYSEAICYVHPQTEMLYFKRHPNKLQKYDLEGNYQGEAVTLSGTCYPLLTEDGMWGYDSGPLLAGASKAYLYNLNEQGVKSDSLLLNLNKVEELNPSEILSIVVFKSNHSLKNMGLSAYNGAIFVKCKEKNIISLSNYPVLRHYKDEIHFREELSDTIYQLHEKELRPKWVFDMGIYCLTPEKQGLVEDSKECVPITYAAETPAYIYFECIKNLYGERQLYYGLYNKKEGKTYIGKAGDGFVDDVNDFLPLRLHYIGDDGEVAGMLSLESIVAWKEAHPNASQEGALSFLKSLDEDANPVCVIVEP